MRLLPILILILLIPLVVGWEECKRVTESINIPCRVTTIWPMASACSDFYSTIYNETGYNLTSILLEPWGDSGNCYFNFSQNHTGSYSYNISNGDTGNILVENGNMWLAVILLIPLGLSFLFVYWGSTLSEDHEPIKWFMRLLSLVMIFVLFAAANMVINLNPGFEVLQDLFNFVWIQWVFYTLFALFLAYFIYRIALAMRWKKKDEFEQGILK